MRYWKENEEGDVGRKIHKEGNGMKRKTKGKR